MNRDVLTVGSTMRIPLLYRGEYSQWVERFINYLEEQTDGEAMINSIKNGDQPLPIVTQVSIAGTSSTEQPPLKDKSMWSDQEKKIQKIDRLAISLLIQGLSNDIYCLIDSNKTAKDLWDALARHMLGSEYGEQDRKAAVLYEYETFKATEGELLLDTYNRYLQVINDLKKCSYSKDNCELNFKFLNNLQPEWKHYATMMKQNKNLMDINIDALYNILKQNQGYVNDVMGLKKKIVVITSDNKKASSSFVDDKISEVSYYLSESESESEYETSDYYDNTTTYGLFVNDNDDQEIFHDCENFLENLIESQINHNESVVDHNDYEGIEKYAKLEAERYEYKISYSAYFDNDKQHRKQIADQEVLYDKMSVQLVELDKHVRDLKNTVLEKDFKISELEECVRNKDLEIEKCLERLNVCENKLHKMGQTNQTVHMIMPSNNTLYNSRKGIGFEIPSYFEKANYLRLSLYDEKVIGLGYTLMFLTHSNKALETEKFKRARENKIKFVYDYGSLNASYVNEKIIFSDDYFQEIVNPDFEKIDSPFQQTSSLKPYVPILILEKIIIDLEDEVVSLLEKEKANLETIKSLKSKVNHSKLNKDVKRYSRKDLLSCNNSHLGKTSSAYVCNDAMNVSCNSRLCDSFDENNLFIFDNESVSISPVSKMPFRKKPRDYINVRSKSNSNKSLPRTVHRWLPRMQQLAAPVAKWIPKICLWIIDSGCSKHMTGNSALLTNFVERFLGTVRFGNNDFVVIAGYGDVESSSSSLNDDVKQSPEEVILPQTNTQPISNNMIPNVDEASTSYNVFNERLEDA
nr:hypothetical protein [Tanacetum cinerariifolium]